MDGNNSQKNAATLATKKRNQQNDAIFNDTQLQEFGQEFGGTTNNVFHVTSFSHKHLYQYFCKSTKEEYDKLREKKKAVLENLCPEMFQIVLVASGLL